MATLIGEATSRIRNQVKAVKEDPFLTDRFLYSLLLKYAHMYIRRMDSLNQMIKFSTLFETLSCMRLITVDRIEACCTNIKIEVKIKRTEEKIPGVMTASFGPLIRTVSSADGSEEVYPTTPSTYTSMTKTTSFKYNKNKYYWFLNGYLYFPDVSWDQIAVDGIFEGDTTKFRAENKNTCISRQEQVFPVPDFLFAEIEKQVVADLGGTMQIPPDEQDDKRSNLR